MVITPASTPAGPPDDDEAAEMAARLASGPGFWTDWLAELERQGLLEDLLADGVIARALREAPSGHKYDRVLTVKMTAACVLVACLFPAPATTACWRRRSGCRVCGGRRARRSRPAARSPRPGSCSASRP